MTVNYSFYVILEPQKDSHHVLIYPGDPTRTVTVPVHSGRDLKPGTIRSIIPRTGLSVEGFVQLL